MKSSNSLTNSSLIRAKGKSRVSRILLKDIKNFGPVCSAEFALMGIYYLDELEELGFEGACRLWVENFPERLHVMAFAGVICTLEDTVWTKMTINQKRKAQQMVNSIRVEYGMLPRDYSVKKKAHKKKR